MDLMDFKISQKQQHPSKKEIDGQASWIVLLPPDTGAKKADFAYLDVLKERRKRAGGKDKTDTGPVVTDLPNQAGSRVAFACIKPDLAAFDLLTLARKLVDVHHKQQAAHIAVCVPGFKTELRERLLEAVVAAAAAAAARMPSYKHGGNGRKDLRRLDVYGIKTSHGFRRTLAEAEGNALARHLSLLPSNKLSPGDYLKKVRALARENSWRLDFYDIPALKKKKAGAFLAVAQGSPKPDAGMARLRYTPAGSGRKSKLTLVGKGICYDTGGVSLKPPRYMFGMHGDMQGSAVALGTFLALTRLKVNFPMECWLALATNHIGSRAYNPNDVVVAADGTTIEVVNTDAEGRMVLADTLVLASGHKPGLIIDYATLTGACEIALGTNYSGAFTNRREYLIPVMDAGRDSGERVWPFPTDADYEKRLESDIADIKQCTMEGNADHILAARFLQRFVKNDTPWIHIDLSASANKGGLAHVATETTGFGVRYTLNLLLDKKILK
jgi:leucyl aminopeptidase